MLAFIDFFLSNRFVNKCARKNLAKIPWPVVIEFLLDVEELTFLKKTLAMQCRY